MNYEKLARKFGKKKLYEFDLESAVKVNYGRREIQKILSHREPFLLIDSIDAMDLSRKVIKGKRVRT